MTQPSASEPQSTIDSIAKASILLDEQDLPGLVDIHDRVRAFGQVMVASDLDSISDCLEHTAALIQQIIYRETQDAAAAMNLIRQGIEYAQRAVSADQAGRSVNDIGPSPYAGTASAGQKSEPIDEELLASWVAGCVGGLAELEAQVVSIDTDGSTPDRLADVRRRLHTLKGECGVLSLHAGQKLCHQAETEIDRCIAEKLTVPTEALLALIDWMKNYVAQLAQNPNATAPDSSAVLTQLTSPARPTQPAPPAPSPAPHPQASPTVADTGPVDLTYNAGMQDNLNEFLCEAREHLTNSENALLQLEANPADKELINTVFRAFHTIKGVAGFLNIAPIVRLAHSAEYLLDGARSDKVTLHNANLNLVLKSADLMTSMLKALEGSGTAPSNAHVQSTVADLELATRGESAPVHTTSNQSLSAPAPVAAAPAAAQTTTVATPTSRATTATPAPTPSPAASAADGPGNKRIDQTVKVSTQRMDALVDMVGELVIAQQMVAQDPAIHGLRDQRLNRNLAMVVKIIRDLQEVSMSLRMVPVKATFQKMARLVRDVSAKAGKRITLHTEGDDVELDRTVVEEIADPLVHMIRNACDHGIEPADKRQASGKSESGNIWLRARHSGGSILIEVQDDGKGLDRAKIVAKAVEKGIYTPDRPVDQIPDAEVFALVFLPGFSTAEKVTDLSGRGVGMDVVRRNIEALRGKVDITSVAGKGTLFTMRLPLTLAIIDGMVVRVGAQRYVIPTLSIERSFQPRANDVHTVVGQGRMAMVRDHLLPIFPLHEVLGHAPQGHNTTDDLFVVVENQKSRACLAVDEIIGQQQVVIKSLGQGTQPIRGVSGGAILGDGRVALILDIGGILSEATAA